MPPASRAGGLDESSSEEEEDDDVPPAPPKKTTIPPVKNLPKGGDDASAPLLDKSGSKPTTPRDKFISKSKASTPREGAADLKGSLPDADQAKAQAAAAAEEGKALAMAAASELKNVRALTKEEQDRLKESMKADIAAAKAAAQKLWHDILNDRPPPLFPMADVSKRMEKYIDMTLDALPEEQLKKIPPSVLPLKPKIILTIQICSALFGWIAFIIRWLVRIWNLLPQNLAKMLIGLALCYFGGTFVMTIAAAEAFRTMGAERAIRDVSAIADEVNLVLAANDADDVEDLDGDGVADVDDLTPPQLLQRKAILIMTTVKQPEKIQQAAASLYAAGLAVVATLRLEFAQTTAMAIGVADMVKKPLVMGCKPMLEKTLPPPTHQWIVPTIESALQIFAISVAMYIQQLISSFYSALRGGKMFAGALFDILHQKAKVGVIMCPGVVGPDYDPDNSVVDEIIGWIIMLQGFMFQLQTNFSLPFPFDILLSPVVLLEFFLKAQVVAGAVQDAQGRRMAEDGPLLDAFSAGCVQWANCTCPIGGTAIGYAL